PHRPSTVLFCGAPGEGAMPSESEWAPGAVAAAHVMRVTGCDKQTAIRQIEVAARDGSLRWLGRGSNRWEWVAEVFRADLFKLWPDPAGEVPDEGAAGLSSLDTSLATQIAEAAAWPDQPLPQDAELKRLSELIAGFLGS